MTTSKEWIEKTILETHHDDVKISNGKKEDFLKAKIKTFPKSLLSQSKHQHFVEGWSALLHWKETSQKKKKRAKIQDQEFISLTKNLTIEEIKSLLVQRHAFVGLFCFDVKNWYQLWCMSHQARLDKDPVLKSTKEALLLDDVGLEELLVTGGSESEIKKTTEEKEKQNKEAKAKTTTDNDETKEERLKLKDVNIPLLVVGYDDEGQKFQVCGCWGPLFGKDGFFFVPYRHFLKLISSFALLKKVVMLKPEKPRPKKKEKEKKIEIRKIQQAFSLETILGLYFFVFAGLFVFVILFVLYLF